MTISLGTPTTPSLAPRRETRKITLHHPTHPIEVGGGAPISVQSMTTTVTADINSTLQQIAELTATGCEVVRVAVPSADDAEAECWPQVANQQPTRQADTPSAS